MPAPDGSSVAANSDGRGYCSLVKPVTFGGFIPVTLVKSPQEAQTAGAIDIRTRIVESFEQYRVGNPLTNIRKTLTILGLSLAAFEKPTNLLNKRISRFENFGLVLVFVWLVFIFDLHYLASELLGKAASLIQELKLAQLRQEHPEEEAETEPNVWDDESVDVNPFGGGKPRYVNRLYQPRRNDHAVDRDDRYRDDPIRSLGLKIEIPEFTGKVHPDNFIDWLSTVERVFDVRDIPDKLKVKLVAIKLRQHASLWWNHVINEFDKLRMRCDVVEEEEQVVARFFGVLLQPYWTYTDVCHLALKVEKQIKAKSKGSTSRFTPPTRTAPPITPKTAPKATTPTTSDAEPELDEPGDELVYHDRGEALVIQRFLNVVVSKSVDDNSWLRNNIVRTKCTSKGKICDMIIDGGQLRECKENEIISEAPLQVQPLLREFADVIPGDIPPGLPAMRDIQYCIDFIPGSATQNRLSDESEGVCGALETSD
ncbi:hypothetical protein Tco_0039761 [Tanacetum coccineum]